MGWPSITDPVTALPSLLAVLHRVCGDSRWFGDLLLALHSYVFPYHPSFGLRLCVNPAEEQGVLNPVAPLYVQKRQRDDEGPISETPSLPREGAAV